MTTPPNFSAASPVLPAIRQGQTWDEIEQPRNAALPNGGRKKRHHQGRRDRLPLKSLSSANLDKRACLKTLRSAYRGSNRSTEPMASSANTQVAFCEACGSVESTFAGRQE
jgi:hypothetical protein